MYTCIIFHIISGKEKIQFHEMEIDFERSDTGLLFTCFIQLFLLTIY
jgi:hypothetical protein